jgi:hypothetical protein
MNAQFDRANPRTPLGRHRPSALRRVVRIILVLICLALFLPCYFAYSVWQVYPEAKAIRMLRTNGAIVTTYDTVPDWAKTILRGHAHWLWERAEKIDVAPDNNNLIPCMAAVANLKSLREATFNGCAITDNELAQLKGLTSLERLNLAKTQVTDAGLAQLKALTALKALGLSDTQITDAGLAQLQGLTKLQQLGLARTQVTDSGLGQLRNLMALEWLDLGNTKITDVGLAQLKGLIVLQELFLYNTQITDAGAAHLQKALPRCKIDRNQ